MCIGPMDKPNWGRIEGGKWEWVGQGKVVEGKWRQLYLNKNKRKKKEKYPYCLQSNTKRNVECKFSYCKGFNRLLFITMN